ncbi:MAG TPA: ferritin-like domain-containing protein [Kofleriaceae bacterium]|jgi:hypothetical protein|nr:ferritin-like domain-containing protein [Kofleriaceae bacterium]
MSFAGFGKTEIRYDMFDQVRGVDEARRLLKCERIYHRGQELAWDGRDLLAELLAEHGGVRIPPEKVEAVKRIFAIIMWGELAAWKISAQLADLLVPLEAKMAATSQAHDEARHFYVMHEYLGHLGYVPERMDRAPQALLDLVLETDNPLYKLLGMQLMIESLALTIFQTVRELEVEPVLTELMKYYERDEARHVGLGMQYVPSLIQQCGKRELAALMTFQARILFWAVWELKVLEKDFATLGIEPRLVLERGRRKQLAAYQAASQALGVLVERERNPVAMLLNATVEVLFPAAGERDHGMIGTFETAWKAFWRRDDRVDAEEMGQHARHSIRTARGVIAKGEDPVG